MNENATIATIKAALLEEGKVTIAGFGSFKISTQAARTGRNPQNGLPIEIPEKKVVKFVAFSGLKDAVNS